MLNLTFSRIGVAFGLDDYLQDVELPLNDATERDIATTHARQRLTLACAAHGVAAYESPFINFRDEAGLRQYARRARLLGFKGAFAIHPAQVEPLNEMFAPSEAELSQAAEIVRLYDEAAAQGRGSTKTADGMMIDGPVYRRALALLKSVGKV